MVSCSFFLVLMLSIPCLAGATAVEIIIARKNLLIGLIFPSAALAACLFFLYRSFLPLPNPKHPLMRIEPIISFFCFLLFLLMTAAYGVGFYLHKRVQNKK